MYSDRLTTYHTVVILMMCATATLLAPCVFDNIQCNTPAAMTQAQIDMIHASCYGAPWYPAFVEYIPIEDEETPSKNVSFYQWTGVFLALQAFLFFISAPIWVGFQRLCGINVNGLLATAGSCHTNEEIYRRRHFRGVARIIRSSSGKSFNLMICYTLVKLLHLVISVGQVIWLNRFLGSQFGGYGLEALHHIRTGSISTGTPTFPRQGMCDTKIRQLGNIQRYTVQCVLPLNYVFEGITILVWFWLLFIATANLTSFCNHVISMSVPAWQRAFLSARLAALGEPSQGILDLSKDEYLIIRHLAVEDELLAAEILIGLEDGLKPTAPSGGKMENPSIPSASQQLYPSIGTL